ncbi:MAG: hypothetical protein RLZZ628_1168 [Bacteroidota bacterium]|jgi:SAM-dependent methyltransferase
MTTTELTQLAADYYQEGVLDKDAWFRVADADYHALLKALDTKRLFEQPTCLLDIGCGTGRFPALLRPYLSTVPITYDFLDPSQLSLEWLRKSLKPPYQARHAIQMGVQSLADWQQQAQLQYDLIWGIHALHFVQPTEIPQVLQTIQRGLKPDTGIALGSFIAEDCFYIGIHDCYCRALGKERQNWLGYEPYTQLGFEPLKIPRLEQTLEFVHRVAIADTYILENYLQQCVFDKTYSLQDWFDHPMLNAYLRQYQVGAYFEFPQKIIMIQFGDLKRPLLQNAILKN